MRLHPRKVGESRPDRDGRSGSTCSNSDPADDRRVRCYTWVRPPIRTAASLPSHRTS